MKHTQTAIVAALALAFTASAHANGLPAAGGSIISAGAGAESSSQSTAAGGTGYGQGGNASASGSGGNSSSNGGSGGSVGGHNTAIALPTPVSGVRATIAGCTIAGNESVGLFFNLFSHSRTTIAEDRFCKQQILERLARENGETTAAAAIRAQMREELDAEKAAESREYP